MAAVTAVVSAIKNADSECLYSKCRDDVVHKLQCRPRQLEWNGASVSFTEPGASCLSVGSRRAIGAACRQIMILLWRDAQVDRL